MPRDRRDTILRAAEKVFALEGYHGTTMRQIATEAGVQLSLVVYHFTAKINLYTEIFRSRQYINDDRLARLAAVDLTAPDAVDNIVKAFVDPVLALHDNPGDVWFARLVFREAADPSSQQRAIMAELFDPMARQFIAALRTALPDKPPGFHEWAYLFSVGALTQSAFDTRIARLTDTPTGDKHAFLRSYIVGALVNP
ncbi:TetR/AcrR family transcriptional regulator [Actinocrispum sp. NPDC049592]|uniref:TetR/AcrR family transcriptional regulator n=1 Tax=Actinocrispum sp. NPDC049592 TaxID=3154835 RepID=UPI00342A1334